MFIEFAFLFVGAIVGVFVGYRWGKQDAPKDAQQSLFAEPQGGGGPVPEK